MTADATPIRAVAVSESARAAARLHGPPALGAHKVNIKGESVTVDPDGPLAEATWAKQRLGRVLPKPAQRLLRPADATDVSAC